MTSEPINHGCYYSPPTLNQRFWRAMGFCYHYGEEPADCEALSGCMMTDIRLHFSFLDRLRLLLTGRLYVASIVRTDSPSPTVCKSRVDFRIYMPGERSNEQRI
jgi:hypothetical protein